MPFVALALAASLALWAGRSAAGLTARRVLLVAVALRCLALPQMPGLSDDGYRYLWDGVVWVQEGRSPYRGVPADQPEAAPGLVERMNSATLHSVYPPASQAVFSAAVWGAQGHLGVAWYLLKGLLLLAEGAGLWAMSRVVRPQRLLLYAWHPLAVVEVAGQGHTEGLLVGALGVVLWAWTARPWVLAAGAALAVSAKLWPAALAGLVVRRVGLRRTALLALAAAVGWLPWVAGWDASGVLRSLRLYSGGFDWYSAPYLIGKAAAWPVWGTGSGRVVAIAMTLAWAGLAVGWTLSGARRDAVVRIMVAYAWLSPVLHPWHGLGALLVMPLLQSGGLTFWLLSIGSATYLAYTSVGEGYLVAVCVGWGGALVGLAPAVLRAVMRRRGAAKWRRLRPLLGDLRPSARLLDLGAAEGHVGDEGARETGAAVTLADVGRWGRTARPTIRLTPGQLLPFADDSFDEVVLSFVLHHAADPAHLLDEALRVCRGTVAVLETAPRRRASIPLLQMVDDLANRVRSHGAMHDTPARLRTPADWVDLAASLGGTVSRLHTWGWLHPQARFAVQRASTSSGASEAGTHQASA